MAKTTGDSNAAGGGTSSTEPGKLVGRLPESLPDGSIIKMIYSDDEIDIYVAYQGVVAPVGTIEDGLFVPVPFGKPLNEFYEGVQAAIEQGADVQVGYGMPVRDPLNVTITFTEGTSVPDEPVGPDEPDEPVGPVVPGEK